MTSRWGLRGFLAALACALLLMVTLRANAQYASGISATVVDQSGAVVAGAQLTATNEDTHVSQTAVSDAQGFVQVLHLAPGKYRVEISTPGFESWVQTDVLVEGSAMRTLYPKLSVGQAVTTVEVRSDRETLETSRGTISRTLEQQTVAAAPLVGENLYASVASLAPGVTGLGDASGSIAAAGSQGTNSFSSEAGFQINAAGQRQEANEFQVDGTTVNGNSRDGVVNITPEPDTVAEMKVTASTFSAEKGRQSGALIEIFTKPGTNQFHGSLSEMHTDAAMTARTVFQPTGVPHSVRNDFGGTIGGPIFKNKTFFFGSLFWMKSTLGQTFNGMVETKEFEDYVKTNYPDSMAARFFSAAPPKNYPTSNFLTVADVQSDYWSSYTPPDIPSTLVAEGRSLINNSPLNNGFQGHVRIDHNLRGDKDKLFYSMFRNTTQAEHADARPVYAYINPNSTLYNKLDYLHTFSPNLVNELGITYNRLTGSQPDRIPELPNVAWIGGIDATYWQWGPSGWVQNNWFFNDSMTWVHNSHTFHAGIDIDRQQDMDDFTNGEDRPYFLMLNVLDMAADHPFQQSGPVLDVTTSDVAHNLYQRILMLYVAPYVQDDWKVNSRLTVNLGVRFDYFGHLSTVQNGHDAIAFFTPGSGTTFAQQVADGSMLVRSSNGQATNGAQFRLAPRIGFAWDVLGNGSLAIHGGYGLFNNRIGEYSYVNNMRTNPPKFVNPSISIFSPGVTLDNMSYGVSSSGAQGFAPPPGISYEVDPNGGLVGTRIAVGGISPNLEAPLVHNWALGVQKKVAGFVVEADYFGTASRKLYLQTDVNRFAGDMIENNGSLTRLNSSFDSVTYGRSIGISNSNLGAFGISRHFSRGWSAHATYTWGKSLDLTSSNDNGVGGGQSVFDAQTLAGQYGRSDYDSRHRLSVDAVWRVPGLRSGIAKLITDGWSFSPIIILQSGQPFTVYNGATYSQGGDYNADGWDFDMPDAPSFGRHISTSRSDFLKGLFKASDFPRPAAGTEGNLGRNTYDGPGYANVNLSAQRTFAVKGMGDSARFELRGEILNLFNRVNLINPVSDMSSTQFGYSTGQITARTIQVTGHFRF
ncbi:MAG TPA: carboxypeptidase regulatory-like domain-containing protein [Terracidiphilus sp.]|nr:carboxypeptidase regulatory-like domain-containing protein [Terracidiphilus sp.]